MANREIEKVPIDKSLFMAILNAKKQSIRSLAKLVDRNEKTLRRYFNSGEIPPYLLKKICECLDIQHYNF